jgi:hypothetical protein
MCFITSTPKNTNSVQTEGRAYRSGARSGWVKVQRLGLEGATQLAVAFHTNDECRSFIRPTPLHLRGDTADKKQALSRKDGETLLLNSQAGL